jgi:hypothetical protein
MDAAYYVHASSGQLDWEFGKGTKLWQPWWAIVLCDQGIIDYYGWLCRRNGLNLQKGSAYGAHISFLRGEEPLNKELWGDATGPVSFHYAHQARWDNERHVWLDCWSDQLNDLRAYLGLPTKKKMSYHLTIGRL